MVDAFALPFREFQRLRQYALDEKVDELHWATPEGEALLLYRDALESFFWEVRAAVGELDG